MSEKPAIDVESFGLSTKDRDLLLEALGEHAWRYRGQPKAEQCELLADRLRPQLEDAPPTDRIPTTISSIPPSADHPLFI